MNLFQLQGEKITDRLFEGTKRTDGTLCQAVFSLDRKYRYALARSWRSDRPICIFVMLNPSTADGYEDDATVRSCTRLAREMGRGGFIIVNLFALRSTEPAGLKSDPDPIGPLADEYLLDASTLGTGHKVIVAWGSHAKIRDLLTLRAREALKLLRRSCVLWSFGHNKDLQPKHPLYLPTNASVQPYLIQDERKAA